MEWYESIPVNINNNGDSLVENQAENTVEKIRSLEGMANIYHICTKAVLSNKAFEILESLTKKQKEHMFLSYSLTGLNEGGFSFEEREETIHRLCSIAGAVTILLRPLIKGRNDSKDNIDRIIRVASENGGRIILGGLHSKELIKQISGNTEDYFMSACKDAGVKYFNKTSCAVADLFHTKCRVHGVGNNEPRNLEVLDMLGYQYDIVDGSIVLEQASSGDLNFVRYITNSIPYTKKVISRLNRITSVGGHNYEVTSGWFSWSENKPCNIGCDYCVMSQIGYLTDRSPIGCHPRDMSGIQIDCTPKEGIEVSHSGKFASYTDLRRQCECIQYGGTQA